MRIQDILTAIFLRQINLLMTVQLEEQNSIACAHHAKALANISEAIKECNASGITNIDADTINAKMTAFQMHAVAHPEIFKNAEK
jgi:hypothetical protein